jgi:hypothetical protein
MKFMWGIHGGDSFGGNRRMYWNKERQAPGQGKGCFVVCARI